MSPVPAGCREPSLCRWLHPSLGDRQGDTLLPGHQPELFLLHPLGTAGMGLALSVPGGWATQLGSL